MYNGFWNALAALRITAPRQHQPHNGDTKDKSWSERHLIWLDFPMNFVTGPLIADLFLLAISAIHAQEVRGGTIGVDNISPIDIMAFFITLAYIAISIDASGLIRFLAFKVLVLGGEVGHRLFFYLYAFFFSLGTFIGNDPIILSGTAFLAYMTRVSSNIEHPRAWIHTQFAVANIASAILVSSNPTNLVLAGAFKIKFIVYTANMIVPVIATTIVLFPFLLYFIFAEESLIPICIKMQELPAEFERRKPVNPNIPNARGVAEQDEDREVDSDQSKLMRLEEIVNPFLDKGGAAFGLVIMTATLVTVLALNAASTSGSEHPVYWVTVPAAFVMLCWDLGYGWIHRHETREISRRGREEVERARAERMLGEKAGRDNDFIALDPRNGPAELQTAPTKSSVTDTDQQDRGSGLDDDEITSVDDQLATRPPRTPTLLVPENDQSSSSVIDKLDEKRGTDEKGSMEEKQGLDEKQGAIRRETEDTDPEAVVDKDNGASRDIHLGGKREPATLVSICRHSYRWMQETFPTVMAVMNHLPFALVPFALTMFVLVQALVTKGWVPVFAYGWDHWVNKTGVVGSIGGMGFLSVVLCNVSYFRGVTRNSRLRCKPNSLQEPILAPPFFSVGLFKHGSRSIT